ADVLTHAVADSLLGAARQQEIGAHFPDTDPLYANASSLVLLREVAQILISMQYEIIDIDSVIVAEAPRLSPYRDQMRKNIADELNIDISHIGIKATTTEKLGFTGRGEGIAAYASCLLFHNDIVKEGI
ncbi:MAG: 2-C-methyl-D-erythritol 2,4-cyclodiphosphate synthase, partial [Eggerthellaceae bacterium]|nr:2-C-methyl-D-erythritol 2,4-cyclodiphosphate synthase [Eggerthellaceae bacterium]